MKELEKIIAEQLETMEVNAIEPSGMEMQSVYLDRSEEAEWIEIALKYGRLKNSDWKYGKIITGEVTPEFVKMLLSIPKPEDVEIYVEEKR